MSSGDRYLLENRNCVEAFLNLFEFLGSDSETREKVLRDGEGSIIASRTKEQRRLHKLGFFTEADFTFMSPMLPKVLGFDPPINNNAVFMRLLVQRLKDVFVLQDAPVFTTGYSINLERLRILKRSGLLYPQIFGVHFMLQQNRCAIPAVNVRLPNGDEHCGTGFHLRFSIENTWRSFVLTNRHVVEGNTIMSVFAGATAYQMLDEPVLCDAADLALFEVETDDNTTSLVMMGSDPELLSEVIAVGYPKVPLARDQYAFAHKGEVNGTVTTIQGEEYLAISCHVSPGNSGGPVLGNTGEVMAIVTQAAFAPAARDRIEGRAAEPPYTYNMAIPARIAIEFLDSVLGSERGLF